MVNNDVHGVATEPRSADLETASAVVYGYVALTVAAVVALLVLSAVAPRLATHDAWGHAVIAVIFVILLPLRMGAARNGSRRALKAVTIISVVILIVNVVEASLPNAFPGWMRVEMAAIAVLMASLGLLTFRVHRARSPERG